MGGKLRKDVTGYDLTRLLVGSFDVLVQIPGHRLVEGRLLLPSSHRRSPLQSSLE